MHPKEFESAINELLADNKSGSLAILLRLIEISKNYTELTRFNALFLIEQYLLLHKQFPQFAVLFHFINSAFIKLHSLEKNADEDQQAEFKSFLKAYEKNYATVHPGIAENLVKHCSLEDKRVFVHSNSSTVSDALIHLNKHNRLKEIVQTIAYPAKEGIVQAEQFAKADIRVQLIPDAAIFRFVKLTDCVILGADTIFSEFFINKIGSQSIAVAANYYDKPVYVLADSRKIIPYTRLSNALIKAFLSEKEKPETELMLNHHPLVQPRNYYFERTPASLIKAFITEDKVYDINSLSKVRSYEISAIFS